MLPLLSLLLLPGLGLAQGTASLAGLSLLPPAVDHRPLQSPVKFQAGRGTCTAFSVAAMLETFDGVPSDLSEQGAYGYLKLQELGTGNISPGGMLADYPKLLAEVGFMHESVAPYDPKAGLWSEDDSLLKKYLEEGKTGIADLVKRAGTTRYRVEPQDIILLKDNQARDINALKRLLASGHRAIAVGYNDLYIPYWEKYRAGVITPAEGFVFAVGDRVYSYAEARTLRTNLVADVLAGKAKARYAHPDRKDKDYGGHAVTIVGYTPEGFLIKNSWSRNWGMQGYALVSFDFHRLFCDEAVAVKQPTISVVPLNAPHRPTVFLKGRPTSTGTNACLRLTVFAPQQGGLDEVRSLRCEVYEQTQDGLRGRLLAFPPPSPARQAAVGHPVDVLCGSAPRTGQAGPRYWVQVSFASAGESMERILTFPNVTWSNDEYAGR